MATTGTPSETAQAQTDTQSSSGAPAGSHTFASLDIKNTNINTAPDVKLSEQQKVTVGSVLDVRIHKAQFHSIRSIHESLTPISPALRRPPDPPQILPLVPRRNLHRQHHHRNGLREIHGAILRPARALQAHPTPAPPRDERGEPARDRDEQQVRRQGHQEGAGHDVGGADFRGRGEREDREGRGSLEWDFAAGRY